LNFFIILILANTAIDYRYQNFNVYRSLDQKDVATASTCTKLVIKARSGNITPCWCTKEDRLNTQPACV